MRLSIFCVLVLTLSIGVSAHAADFDPTLQAKADSFQDYADEWHTPGLGGLVAVQFTDATRTTPACYHYIGDSTIWTGMYLASQALRYMTTQDEGARDNVIHVAGYFRDLMDITDTLGYIGRYAGPDVPPYNCTSDDNDSWHVHGTGPWDGYFWIHQTSRDQYSGYMLGMSLAYDAVDDPDMRADIKQAMREVVEMLESNSWNITDENGEYTGNHAAWVGPVMRLSWLVQAAHVIDEPYYWDLLDEQYAINKPFLGIDVWAWLNKYSEYFGNNLRHNAFLPIFRYWPDRERLQYMYDVWQSANRPYVKDTHNPWFDAVHIAGCLRLGVCDQDEWDSIAADSPHTLGLYFDPPAYQREVTCSDQPLDPFSVWADQLLNDMPWLRDIVDIRPQTAEAREVNDRHWTDIYWQSTPFEQSCFTPENQTFEGPGMDFLLAYYMDVYYGLLPGDGPYGDDELTDDTADDTSVDDTAADDVADDIADDVSDDIVDDAADDGADDAEPMPNGGGDDDDSGGCAC